MKKTSFDPFVDLSAEELKAALLLGAQAMERANKNFHSISLLNGAYNALTGKKLHETCPSCLRMRVDFLRKFGEENADKINAVIDAEIAAQIAGTPAAPPKPAEPTGRVLALESDGEDPVKIMFDATGKNKKGETTGTVSAETGKTLKPGTYVVAETGETLVVQPGGKATLKPFEDLT